MLTRSDSDLWRICSGSGWSATDWETLARQLTVGHCFEVKVCLMSSGGIGCLDEQVARSIAENAEHRGNAWFYSTFEQAAALFASLLRLPCAESTDDSPHDTNGPVAATEDVAMTDSPPAGVDEDDPSEGDAVWRHVEACPSVEASKAADIRAAIVERLGRKAANRLLSQTKATVAKDGNGHKNRVLRLGGSALKLRRVAM